MQENCVAIDGYSSSGKSSVAKLLSCKLDGYFHLNTGSIYRALALFCQRNNIDCTSEDAVADAFVRARIDVDFDNDKKQQTYIGSQRVDQFLRDESLSYLSSVVSVHYKVRQMIITLQRKLATRLNLVMEGRDITTDVLPQAKYKFFLTASCEIRAKRRFEELLKTNKNASYETVLEDLKKRDERDINRKHGALRIAKNVIVIDSTSLSIDQVVDKMFKIIKESD